MYLNTLHKNYQKQQRFAPAKIPALPARSQTLQKRQLLVEATRDCQKLHQLGIASGKSEEILQEEY